MIRIRLSQHDAARQEAEARVQLASAVGVTAHAMEGVRLDLTALEGAAPDVPSAEARHQALVNRPDVLGALAMYAASQAALQLEVARQYPDIRLGPGYEMDQSDNKWTLGLGVTLPIFNRNQGPIAEADARRTEAAARFMSVQAGAIGGIDLALAAYRAAREKADATDAMRGDLQKQEQTSRAQYAGGQISRLELNGIQLQLAGTELARLDARVEVQRTLGQLEDAMQSPTLADWVSETPPKAPADIKR